MNRRLAAVLVALTLPALTGCLPGERTEHSLHELAPPPAQPLSGEPVAWQLLLDVPRAPAPLAGDRLAVRPAPQTFGVLRGARWVEPAPTLVQGALLRGFQDSGRIVGVARTRGGVHGDYRLLAELEAFQREQAQGLDAVARVALAVQLVRAADGRVVAARRFEAIESAPAGIPETVVALSRATARVVAEIVPWTLSAGEADRARADGPA